jgi:hypothetical protein
MEVGSAILTPDLQKERDVIKVLVKHAVGNELSFYSAPEAAVACFV